MGSSLTSLKSPHRTLESAGIEAVSVELEPCVHPKFVFSEPLVDYLIKQNSSTQWLE